ncbi:MAG: TonB family protein [Vicinamibacterales bacterium]
MSTEVVLANLLAWSLQITAVVCAGGALPAVLRLDAPDLRHGYWRALLLVCLLLPVVQPWHAAPAIASDVAAFETTGLIPAAQGSGSAGSGGTPLWRAYAAARPMFTSVATVLVTGAVIRLGWLGLGLIRLRRLRRDGTVPAVPVSDDGLGPLASAGADVRYVTALGQPITFGAWRPIVLLPAALQHQPEPVRRAVLVHELWHVRRRDWLWVVIEEVVRALFWFHPVVGWVVSRVQASREEVVDELTVLTTNARRPYIEALLLFADEPGIYPATSFARRRHLFRRVLLMSKEAVMSSKRIVLSCAAMGAVVVMGGWYGVDAFPLTAAAPLTQASQAQPRDLRPGQARPASRRETELQAAVTSGAQPASTYLELARLQEARGATREAEATLVLARTAQPVERGIVMALAGLYNRIGQFDQTIETLEQAASMASSDLQAQHLVATYYEEKVRKDSALSPGDRLRYIQAGVAAEDRALQLDPESVDAMIVKNILLRHQANGETSAAARTQLIADADALRNRAMQLQQRRQLLNSANQPAAVRAGADGRMPPPPPPPPPPAQGDRRVPSPPPPPPDPSQMVDGVVPVRVGGEIKVPTKLVNVPPVYPPVAQDARVQGVVIIEAVLDASGVVNHTKVLRSIPLLDQAAIDAVKQWVFTPTLVNGVPMPVIMTVTVNFTLQ